MTMTDESLRGIPGYDGFLDRQGLLEPIDVVFGAVLLVLVVEAAGAPPGLRSRSSVSLFSRTGTTAACCPRTGRSRTTGSTSGRSSMPSITEKFRNYP